MRLRSLISLLSILIVAFFCFSKEARGEAFHIQLYEVDIELNPDGSFFVTETIDLRFNEARRGIIRSIPFRYRDQNVQGEKAKRPIGPDVYEIVLEDIHVEGHQFKTSIDGDHTRIRIGNPDKRIKGEQRYKISYRVWGALNEFSDHVEFTWNIIGNEWDAPIEKATFSISSSGEIRFRADDVVFATGRAGSRGDNLTLNVTPKEITGETIRALKPYEGISLATRHLKGEFHNIQTPLEKFSKAFIVRDHQYAAKGFSPGFFTVEEQIEVDFLKATQSFSRLVGAEVKASESGKTQFPYLQNIKLNSDFEDLKYTLNRRGSYTELVFSSSDGKPLPNKLDIQLSYDIWGVSVAGVRGDHIKLIPSGFYPQEPIQNISATISSTEGSISNSLLKSANSNLRSAFTETEGGIKNIEISYPDYRIQRLQFEGSLPVGFFQEKMHPAEIYARNFLINDMDIEVVLDNRQGLEVTYSYTVIHPFDEVKSTFKPIVLRKLSANNDFYNGELRIPQWNLLDNRVIPGFKLSDENNLWKRRSWGAARVKEPTANALQSPSWTSDFTVFYRGLYHTSESEMQLELPLIPVTGETFRNIDLEIQPPPGIDALGISADLLIDGRQKWSLIHHEGKWILPEDRISLPSGESMTLLIRGPEGFAGSLPIFSSLGLLLRNNMPIWIMAMVILGLYILWNIIGRNRKEAVVVRYYPPEKITSAEAGLLWDDRLHRKDLISLIYYWAGRGHLEVEEVNQGKKKDFILRKKKDIPSSAKSFEKTFFNGIFFKDEVKISELRSEFYSTLRKSHKELMAYGKQNEFYVPGSRGFGCALVGLGVLFLFIGLIGLGVSFFTGHWSYGISPLVMGVAMVLFGKVMPKKGPFGFKKYQKLLGFREFVKSAEIDRVKVLYKENPGYFDSTIAYAIVFGLGRVWASKFDGLMTEPPSWYKGYDSGQTFTTVYFTNALIRSMHRMNYDLSVPPVSSSGTSSWGGGGGSSFGGGFSSGGGFGGGGGTSW